MRGINKKRRLTLKLRRRQLETRVSDTNCHVVDERQGMHDTDSALSSLGYTKLYNTPTIGRFDSNHYSFSDGVPVSPMICLGELFGLGKTAKRKDAYDGISDLTAVLHGLV
jgi:hypothetical protein